MRLAPEIPRVCTDNAETKMTKKEKNGKASRVRGCE